MPREQTDRPSRGRTHASLKAAAPSQPASQPERQPSSRETDIHPTSIREAEFPRKQAVPEKTKISEHAHSSDLPHEKAPWGIGGWNLMR
jgi:hypothetical protein